VEVVVVVIKYWCRDDELMFGWRLEESSIPSLIYTNALSYSLPLSYIISQSTLVLLNSAHTAKVQRCDFISSEYEGKLSYPQFCDPEIASTGCGAPPTQNRLRRFWAKMTYRCLGIGPNPLASSQKR
jgi:hypothetical protein